MFFFPNNRGWVENVDRIAFLAAATKQADQHMADRPSPPISCIRMHTGIISQNVSPFLHFKKRPPLCPFRLYSSVFTEGKYIREGEAHREGESDRKRGKSRHERLKIVWNSLLSYESC